MSDVRSRKLRGLGEYCRITVEMRVLSLITVDRMTQRVIDGSNMLAYFMFSDERQMSTELSYL